MRTLPVAGEGLSMAGPAYAGQPLYHVTVLSNFARGYDKYTGSYAKARIPESTFPDRFFLLERAQLNIGLAKASRLLNRLDLPGDRLIALETRVANDQLRANTTTGLGRYVERPQIRLSAVHGVASDGGLEPLTVEDAMARSLRALNPRLRAYEALRPRSVSLLPVARGCQARCAFCFSRASISSDQESGRLTRTLARTMLREGRRRGAERAVITGGGDPGLVPFALLLELVAECARWYPEKVVLITNGFFLASLNEEARQAALVALEAAGLTVLSLSRHHADASANAKIMGLDVGTERVLASMARARLATLRPRIISVLQRGGVDTVEALDGLLRWAAHHGVGEVTLKELYVSTSEESVYHDHESNHWCRAHQVPLSLATEHFATRGWGCVAELPWGAPIHSACVDEVAMRVAAYTEPSLFWERSIGVARSWNVLSDGACYASLEDRASRIEVS